MTEEVIDCASFWEYLDGELEGPAAKAYLRHLGTCSACRSNMEEHSVITEALGWGGEEEPPAHLRRALLDEFRRGHPPAGRPAKSVSWWPLLTRPLPVPAWTVAALLLGVVGLLYAALGRPIDKRQEATPAGSGGRYIAYQVYGPDGSLKASVQTTLQMEKVQ